MSPHELHLHWKEKQMTDEQINAAIAEACGWRDLIFTGLGQFLQRWMGRKNKHEALQDTPNYCTDLNAMHEAEQRLTKEQSDDYVARLFDSCYESTFATARQRAEAFLRTLGKWEEGK